MDAQMKKDLEAVVNAVINEDSDKAVSSFKAYLKEKTKEILETKSEDESDEDESKDESDEDESDDEEDESDED